MPSGGYIRNSKIYMWMKHLSPLEVIPWAYQIKSGGTFFSNVSELFMKLFHCPRNIWNIAFEGTKWLV